MKTSKLIEKKINPPTYARLRYRLNGASRIAEVTDEPIILGSAPESDILLNCKDIDSRHARIRRVNNHFLIEDQHTRFGTFLNNTRVQIAYLEDGDRIRLGKTTFTFLVGKQKNHPEFIEKSQNVLWSQQLERLTAIAMGNDPVLIQGPSGSGKELVARQVHRDSKRAQEEFVALNCGALSENLIESELFGHCRGSFTGAESQRKGAFQSAEGGTLFLDEIGDLPLSLQPLLLRALENKEIRPLGSDATLPIDVRILAATHRDLKTMVANGTFRADLYYRLSVNTFTTLSLLDRMEDFEDLLLHFGQVYQVSFSKRAINQLKTHDWPGNIRELKHFVMRAQYLKRKVEEEDLAHLLDLMPPSPSLLISENGEKTTGARSIIQSIEKRLIQDALKKNKGNQRLSAKELGIPKSTLHDRIRSYQIDVQDIKSEAIQQRMSF